jgi:hypothetical protein
MREIGRRGGDRGSNARVVDEGARIPSEGADARGNLPRNARRCTNESGRLLTFIEGET